MKLKYSETSAAWPYIKSIAGLLTVPGTKIGLVSLTNIQDDITRDQLHARIINAVDEVNKNLGEIAMELRRVGIQTNEDAITQACRSLSEEIYLEKTASKYYYADFKGIAQLQRLLSLPLDDIFVNLAVLLEQDDDGRRQKENS